jgi:hypothetical protein
MELRGEDSSVSSNDEVRCFCRSRSNQKGAPGITVQISQVDAIPIADAGTRCSSVVGSPHDLHDKRLVSHGRQGIPPTGPRLAAQAEVVDERRTKHREG